MEFYVLVLIGAGLGVVGQSLRAAIGFKKAMDDGRPFVLNRLVVSLVFGAIAGAIATVTVAGSTLTSLTIPTIMAAGYAGSDFIEGLVNRSRV